MLNRDIDIKEIVEASSLDLNLLYGKTILITGALGMLASSIVEVFMYLNRNNGKIKLILNARNRERLEARFGEENNHIEYLVQDIKDKIVYNGNIDYIIHAAGGSSPYQIKSNPIGIIEANVLGSLNISNLACEKNVVNCLFTSTREIYGDVKDRLEILEDTLGIFDPLDSRSCYPESKRMAENIFKSASLQYGIRFNTVRIAHSYGPGMILSDGRVMSDLIGNVVSNQDIILKSDGSAIRSFCYSLDAALGILFVLLKGRKSEAYNIANEDEEISILGLSKILCEMKENKIKVVVNHKEDNNVYCKYERTKLSTKKLRELGWFPTVKLEHGISKTLLSFSEG